MMYAPASYSGDVVRDAYPGDDDISRKFITGVWYSVGGVVSQGVCGIHHHLQHLAVHVHLTRTCSRVGSVRFSKVVRVG